MLPVEYAVVEIDPDDLAATSYDTSNYAEVFDAAVLGDDPTWVLEYTNGSWEPDRIPDWYTEADEMASEDLVAAAYLTGFVERLGLTEGRLTRLRTTLVGEHLVDMSLMSAPEREVRSSFSVMWDGAELVAPPSRPHLGAFLLFVPVVFVGRRRRRAAR